MAASLRHGLGRMALGFNWVQSSAYENWQYCVIKQRIAHLWSRRIEHRQFPRLGSAGRGFIAHPRIGWLNAVPNGVERR